MTSLLNAAFPAIPDAVALAVLVAALLAAAFVRGFTGFGFSALIITSTALVISPLVTIPMVMVWEQFASLGQARKAAGDVDVKMVLVMLAGAAIAMPFSLAVINSLDVNVVRAVIAIFVLVMCVMLLAGWSLKSGPGPAQILVTGIFSGLANGAAVGGLPVGLMMSAWQIPPAIFRANMIAYLFAIDAVALVILAFKGVLTTAIIQTAVSLTPVLGLGVWLGGRHFFATPPASFKRFVIILLMALSVLGLIRPFI